MSDRGKLTIAVVVLLLLLASRARAAGASVRAAPPPGYRRRPAGPLGALAGLITLDGGSVWEQEAWRVPR